MVKENLEIGCSIIQKRVMDTSRDKLLNQDVICTAIEKRKKVEQFDDPEYFYLKEKVPIELRDPSSLSAIYQDF